MDEAGCVTGQFVNQYDLTFPVLIDKDGSIKETYRVGDLPVSFLVDENGMIEKVHEGELPTAIGFIQPYSLNDSMTFLFLL